MEKLGMWLVALIAVVFLAHPQSDNVTEITQFSTSVECVNEESDDGADILLAVLVVIIIYVIADACEENQLENI